MVEKVIIKNNTKSPLYYLPNLDNFKNGSEFNFKKGVNIIVGENGCGKTTLLNLIRRYLLVNDKECSKGVYNKSINSLYKGFNFLDGVEVFADYNNNTFNLIHAGERRDDDVLQNKNTFTTFFNQTHASTGEGVTIALQSLFNYMFSPEAMLKFDYTQFNHDDTKDYFEYIEKHKIDCVCPEYTTIMDEPDRNLSLQNLKQIKEILSFHKEQTQLIVTIHNPLLIYSLSKNKEINFIEMTDGYINEIVNEINNLIK